MDRRPNRWLIVALGVTQITSWGSIFYSFGFLLQPMQQALGAGRDSVSGAFSVALLASGLAATPVGTLIDRFGGRGVMSAGSIAAALLLGVLGQVQSLFALYLIYAALGLVMACTLYEPAFAVLMQVYRDEARRAISVLTLFGGLASTVFWPTTEALIAAFGWRGACTALALVNLLVCVPLHAVMLPRGAAADPPSAGRGAVVGLRGSQLREAFADRRFRGVAAALFGYSLVFASMSVHLMSMLQEKGLSSSSAAAIGAMVGPMQVLGRVLEMRAGRGIPVMRVGRVVITILPIALMLFWLNEGSFALFAVFAMLYGMANGVMTIVRGNVVAELFGREHYGQLSGALAATSILAIALGPVLTAMLWRAGGNGYGLVLPVLVACALASVFLFVQAGRARVEPRA